MVDDGSPDDTYLRGPARLRRRSAGAGPHQAERRQGERAQLRHSARAAGEIIVALDADTLFDPDAVRPPGRAARRPACRRRRGQRQGRQPDQPRDPVAGARVHHVAEPRSAGVRAARLHHGRAGGDRRVAQVAGARSRRLLERHAGRGPGSHAVDRRGATIESPTPIARWHGPRRPTRLRGLAKQRFRWSFGTLQCAWKHRDLLFRPRAGTLGFIALPNVWIFQVGLSMIAPVADLVFVFSLLRCGAHLSRAQHDVRP